MTSPIRRVARLAGLAVALVLVGIGVRILLPVQRAPTSPERSTSSERLSSPAYTVSTTTPDTARTLVGYSGYAATVKPASIEVRDAPAPGAPVRVVLPDHNENGAPQTFFIKDEQRDASGEVWYRVLLPIRPNGTTGWVRAADVEVSGLPYRLVVYLAQFRLDVFQGPHLLRSIELGVGTDQTPTPGGEYYIKELLRPPDPNTVYGHYVFGLSGFSNVLVNWPDGGVLGIHGTNDPAHAIARKVSHGCLRMRNEDIEYLAGLLPLGTPVEVET